MTKSSIIKKLNNQLPHLSQQIRTDSVNVILNKICEQLQQGGRVEIRDFGIFSTKTRRNTHQENNPISKLIKEDKDINVMHFKASKHLKDKLNAQ